jgi:hypothetical protein
MPTTSSSERRLLTGKLVIQLITMMTLHLCRRTAHECSPRRYRDSRGARAQGSSREAGLTTGVDVLQRRRGGFCRLPLVARKCLGEPVFGVAVSGESNGGELIELR